MKTLAEQIARVCVHFNGLQNQACEAGVEYDSVRVRVEPAEKRATQYPCFLDGKCHACASQRFLTPEEVEAEVKRITDQTARVTDALVAAKEDAKKQGFRKGKGGTGSLKCPNCEDGTLRYSVAAINGHMWAACTTKGCCGFLE